MTKIGFRSAFYPVLWHWPEIAPAAGNVKHFASGVTGLEINDLKARQYHSEVFQRFIGRLLRLQFPKAGLKRDLLFPAKGGDSDPRPVQFDFGLLNDGKLTVVETKTIDDRPPVYSGFVIRQVTAQIDRLPSDIPVEKVILALSGSINPDAEKQVDRLKGTARAKKIEVEIWDDKELKLLAEQNFKQDVSDFSVESMLRLLQGNSADQSDNRVVKRGAAKDSSGSLRSQLREGLREDVVVLMADFCSYSRFVNASGNNRELITSIMSRFYRAARSIVQESHGVLDKFMGDGLLAFWLPPVDIATFERCLFELVGMSVRLASSWQEQLDIAVSPTGMRCGASLGEVLFVQEAVKENSILHAIGESINLAARLQSAAKPNAVVISNKLRQKHFGKIEGVLERDAIDAKNIGTIKAWEKDLVSSKST